MEVGVEDAGEQVVEGADCSEAEEPPRVGVDVRLAQPEPAAGDLPDVREQPVSVRNPPQEHEDRHQVQADRGVPSTVTLHDQL